MKNKYYQKYHKHTSYSNVYTKDSPLLPIDYWQEALKENTPQIYCTMEHGYQSAYFRIYDELEQFNKANNCNIKFVFGAEIYWVKDRLSKDNSNCHMVLMAKNENGRRAINKAISIANKTGYYYKPRLDLELILNLPKDDVFVTTACIGYWSKYDDMDDITLQLNNHFTDFYLEIQANDTPQQIKINKHILDLHKQYNIPLIAGTDTHILTETHNLDRDDLLKSSKISYAEEEGWYMDMPSYDELVHRFKQQNIFTEDEIIEAIENTNLTLEFEDIVLDRSMKLPTLYPNLSQQEKDNIFIEKIHNLWCEESKRIPEQMHSQYKQQIVKELNEILGCGMCDYFLFNEVVIQNGIKDESGELTQSGRGSNVAMYLNKLLGFTNIDCISAPIDMYSERFLTKERILESKTPPDEDFNVVDRQPFIKAQKKLLGEKGCYDLIAFGTLKLKSAFKMYARANDIDPDVANEVSKQIDKYEKALLYAEEDEKEDIDVFDYVDKSQFEHIIEGCQRYLGIIDNRKGHPCGTCVASRDLEEEIGIILCKSETTGNEVLTVLIESITIDSFGWLKNDFLIVDSTRIINQIYKRIGIQPIEVNDLLKLIKDDKKVWDVYAKGLTLCINQCEKDKTTQKMMKYKAQNIVELTKFISAIRPSFKSLYSKFESREKYEYGIKVLDNLLQNEYSDSSFILFQEDLMKILNFAGFPMKDTYTIIKAISKKKKQKIAKVKPIFIKNFSEKILESGDANSNDEALELAEKVWGIVDDFSSYGFNSPHGFSYAIDSVTQAWQKANYPYEFYEVVLKRFTEKGEKNKVSALKQEMSNFGIELKPIKFRDDNRDFTAYKEKGYITQPLNSIKNVSKLAPNTLYEMRDLQFDSFIDLLIYTTEQVSIEKRTMEILIKLDYFSEFGTINNLLAIYTKFRERYKKTYVDSTKVKRVEELREYAKDINIETTEIDKIKYDIDIIGYSDRTIDIDNTYSIVCDMEFNQYGTPFAILYNLKTGTTAKIKVLKWYYNKKPLHKLDVIKIGEVKNEKKQWITDRDEYELILKSYGMVIYE